MYDVNKINKYEPSEQERKLSEWVNTKFKQAYIAKAPLAEKWKKYMKAYTGELFIDESRPSYKSNEVSNLIFSCVEAIRPIMTDNNPKFIAMPVTPEGQNFSNTIQMALDYEWDRERMGLKLPAQLIPMLVYGTCVWFIRWDGKDGEQGNIKIMPVDPFNIFPDPLGEDVDSCEYIIYATYKNANQLKQLFPKKASAIEGSRITISELVNERDQDDTKDENQVLILEMWCKDWVTKDKDVEGNEKLKYPKGRVITCLPELGIILEDKKNPYKDGKFPFVLMKNYDVPFKFWGVGEVEQILSPQMHINELTNQIIDNAKNTANMPWIIDKNCGIGVGKLTNRPGLVIRKNPGSEVRRDNPPVMPEYVRLQIDALKSDIQDISGVLDSLRGDKQTGITTASAILALQESSQSRIRLKIKVMEYSLGDVANMVYSRMQQFWKFDRWVRVTDIEGNTDLYNVNEEILKNNYDMKVVAGSTMPVNKNALLDLMIRLAQTNAEDGLPVVDRRALLEFLPVSDKRAIVQRYDQLKQQQEQQQQEQLNQQLQQQQQGMQTQDRQELANMGQYIQQMLQGLDQTSKQVDSLILDKEQREQKQRDDELEEKGYQRGLKEGARQLQEQSSEEPVVEEEVTPDVPEEQEGMTPEMADMELERRMNEQQIPDEVLQELLQLSQSEPETFVQLLQQYPELLEMLKQDMDVMNGGNVNEQ